MKGRETREEVRKAEERKRKVPTSKAILFAGDMT
jgi:hypothetical protein